GTRRRRRSRRARRARAGYATSRSARASGTNNELARRFPSAATWIVPLAAPPVALELVRPGTSGVLAWARLPDDSLGRGVTGDRFSATLTSIHSRQPDRTAPAPAELPGVLGDSLGCRQRAASDARSSSDLNTTCAGPRMRTPESSGATV